MVSAGSTLADRAFDGLQGRRLGNLYRWDGATVQKGGRFRSWESICQDGDCGGSTQEGTGRISAVRCGAVLARGCGVDGLLLHARKR